MRKRPLTDSSGCASRVILSFFPACFHQRSRSSARRQRYLAKAGRMQYFTWSQAFLLFAGIMIPTLAIAYRAQARFR
jgi:hypothetical protein